MHLKKYGLPVVFLHAGEHYISREPELITTVLGSCISVVLYSSQANMCAITHSLLPSCSSDASCCTNCTESYRYVDCSIIKVKQLMLENGARIGDTEAKVFGGAGILNSTHSDNDKIGQRNTAAALDTLKSEGIRVVSQDTGGTRGRKMLLFSHTGEVLIKKLNVNDNLGQ